MENRGGYRDEGDQEETRDPVYGNVPSESSPHTRVDATEIRPAGTGCRTFFIFIILASLVLGFIYFYRQGQIQDQPIPENTPPGQTR